MFVENICLWLLIAWCGFWLVVGFNVLRCFFVCLYLVGLFLGVSWWYFGLRVYVFCRLLFCFY